MRQITVIYSNLAPLDNVIYLQFVVPGHETRRHNEASVSSADPHDARTCCIPWCFKRTSDGGSAI